MKTQLTIYTCLNPSCDLHDIPYQLREKIDGKLLVEFLEHGDGTKDYTINCNFCGKPRKRDRTTTIKED